MAYLSKNLVLVAQGWPACLQIIAATALLVTDADKNNHVAGTCYHHATAPHPHTIEGILKSPPSWWLSKARLVHFQLYF